jgi:hypothetical protein
MTKPPVLISLHDNDQMLLVAIEEIMKIINTETGRPRNRERALAVTKLEEAWLWLAHDVRKNPHA